MTTILQVVIYHPTSTPDPMAPTQLRSRICILMAALSVMSYCSTAAPVVVPTPAKMEGLQKQARLLFTENKGQVMDASGKPRPDILFTAHSGGAQLFITATGINYQFMKTTYPEGYDRRHPDPLKQADLEQHIKHETYRFSLTLAGANAHPIVSKEGKNSYYENFYTTGCPDGITNIGAYEKIVYKDVYPHIDWVVYSNGNKLKYDFLVHLGGDAKQIQLKIDDAQNVQLTKDGELLMQTTLGEVREQAPVSYADDKEVSTRFKQNSDGSIGFDVGEYGGKELRIDPTVAWATYYGGSGEDDLFSCSYDGMGYIYATGRTASSSNIASGGYSTYVSSGFESFLVKFDLAGNRLWGIYYTDSLAGIFNFGGACTPDGKGNVYVAGRDAGLAFLAKFDGSGQVRWVNRYGVVSNNYSCGNACAVDRLGNVYVSGATIATADIPTNGAGQTIFGGGYEDGFLVKCDSNGIKQWGTYYGGEGNDFVSGMVVDSAFNIYVCGTTTSASGIGTWGTHQPDLAGNRDAFLAKFTGAGTLQWGTFFGGSDDDAGGALTIDMSGNIYMNGVTKSATQIATTGAYQSILGGDFDIFLAKFTPVGILQWGTYYGGSGNEYWNQGISYSQGDIFLTGQTTSSSNIATSDAFQPVYAGNVDGLLAKFDTLGNRRWATYYGGADPDMFYGDAVDNIGNIYCIGSTSSSSGVATVGAFQSYYNGNIDGLFVKFLRVDPVVTTGLVAGNTFCPGATLTVPFTASGDINSINHFIVQLSDATGSFLNPVAMDTIAGTTSGSFTCIIPVGTLAGTAYRIRVVSSSPYIVGSDNGVDITVLPPAITPVFAYGPISHRCRIAGSVTYAATAASNNTITYSLDSITASYPGNSIDPATGVVTYASGWLGLSIITATSSGCNTSATASHTVTTAELPIAAPVAASSGLFCAGNTVPVHAIVDTSYHYQWQLNGVDIPGADSATYDAPQSGDYDVVITTASGCIATTAVAHVNLVVVALPTPGIYPVVTHLCVQAYSNDKYQWYFNGVAIQGDTTACIEPLHDGDYTVLETNDAGCSRMSMAYRTDLAVGSVQQSEVMVYPDPVSTIVNINAPFKVNVSICSMDGRQVLYAEEAGRIDVSKLPDAVYLVKVYDKTTLIKMTKIVKAE